MPYIKDYTRRSDISNVLIALDSNGGSNGEAVLNNQVPPAIPNAGGQTAKTNLEWKGWNVQVDS